MSNLKVTNIQSNGTGFNDVVSFQNASGTQNGTLCRAFVNFNGTGTVAIRASFNVSSITDHGGGDYAANFSNNMPDANYCANATTGRSPNDRLAAVCFQSSPATSNIRIQTSTAQTVSGVTVVDSFSLTDKDQVHISVFR